MDYNNAHRQVHERHHQYKAEIIEQAKMLALDERPTSSSEVKFYFGEIRAKYIGLMRMVNSLLHPRMHAAMGPVELNVSRQEATDLDNKIADSRHRLKLFRLDNPTRPNVINVPLRSILVLVITFIIFGAQGMWESGAFIASGETRFRATIIGIGFCLGFALFAHVAVWVIRKIQARRWKIVAAVLTILLAFAGYLAIGKLRSRYLAEYLEYTEGLELSPVLFALLSVVLFIAVGALAIVLLPSIEQVEEYRALKKIRSKEASMEQEVETLEAERDAMPRRFAENMKHHARMVEAAEGLRLQIRQVYRDAHTSFVRTNVARRKGDPPDDMFNEPPELNEEP